MHFHVFAWRHISRKSRSSSNFLAAYVSTSPSFSALLFSVSEPEHYKNLRIPLFIQRKSSRFTTQTLTKHTRHPIPTPTQESSHTSPQALSGPQLPKNGRATSQTRPPNRQFRHVGREPTLRTQRSRQRHRRRAEIRPRRAGTAALALQVAVTGERSARAA
jgi:hypothetical protein